MDKQKYATHVCIGLIYYPGIGIHFADQLPRNPKAYQGWLKLSREVLDDRLEQARRECERPDQEHYTTHGYTITRNQPCCDDGFFQMDLDSEVFYVQHMPLFRLDNLPGRDSDFENCIDYDSYGHPTCGPFTPGRCRYNWRAPPPQIPQVIVDRYVSCSTEHTVVPIHELLDISEAISAPEATCVNLFQEIVRCGMELRHIASSIRHLETVSSRDEIPKNLLTFGRALAGLSHGPFIYSKWDHSHGHTTPKDENGYTWLDPRTCLRFTTHLDDQRSLQAIVTDLVAAVIKRPGMQGIVYGIGFSFFHCVIVRINVDNCGSFKHTPAFQFLPSFHTQSSSTPGITALVRLGYLSEPLDLLRIPSGELPMNHLLNNMPLELWSLIADDLFSTNDLITLGSISPRAWVAANALLKFPRIENSRLIGLGSNTPFYQPTKFKVACGGMLAVGTNPWREYGLVDGKVCLLCKRDEISCKCMDECNCYQEGPWSMRYVYLF